MNCKVVLSVVLALCAVHTIAADDFTKIIDDLIAQAQKVETDIENEINSEAQKVETEIENVAHEVQQEIDDIYNEIKQKTEEIIECFVEANATLAKDVNSAESQINGFILREGIKVLPLIGRVKNTVTELQELQTNFTNGLDYCNKHILTDPTCIPDLNKSTAAEVDTITVEVAKEVTDGASLLKTVESDSETQLSKLVGTFTSETKDIISDLNTCIKNAP